MGSKLKAVSNFAFGTVLFVALPSYYVCTRTKIYNKKRIEEIMNANDFSHESTAPEQPSIEDHPFLRKVKAGEVRLTTVRSP